MKGLNFLIQLVLWLGLGLISCAMPQRSTSEPTAFARNGKDLKKGPITQAELQDDILRFESQFNARIQSANHALETSKDLKIRYRAALNRLVYSSNSLNIAVGPSPESNLLDMVTFIELSSDVLKKHWIPDVFGEDGKPLEKAFAESRDQIWAITEKVLDTKQKSLLQNVISTWREKHPNQIDVETVRLSAYSNQVAAREAGLDENVGGLFASVQQSTEAVDSARLFAERALYYAERAPFLLRLQARLGAAEILNDASLSLAQFPNPLDHEHAIKGLMTEFQRTLSITRATLGDARASVQSVGALMKQMSDNPETAHNATATITQLTGLLKEWNHLLSSPPSGKNLSQLPDVAGTLASTLDGLLSRLAWVAAGLIALFWILFVVSKLAYHYLALKIPGTRSSNEEDRKNKAA